MKVLLIGEYSNVHATLASGLRKIGHDVTVVSNGDFWKDYPRDIDVSRKTSKWGGIMLMLKVMSLLPRLRNYDIVQIINPMFLELKAERLFNIYKYLRTHNKRVVMTAMGMDWYWVYVNTHLKPLRYSDFNIGNETRTDEPARREQQDWMGTMKEKLNKTIANDCDAIVTGLYEYDVCYRQFFPNKTFFIPQPIVMPTATDYNIDNANKDNKLKLFIGISKNRSEYKGTDIMLKAAEDIARKYPDMVELRKVEGVPFAQYKEIMNGSDAILDQLYSYTPSMNPLEAMSKGIICIGGGEPECYEILQENELRPIINVLPNYESVYNELEQLVLHRDRIEKLKRESIEYVRRHHEYVKEARQYEELYMKLLHHEKQIK